jgi:hypothetical protein
MKGWIHTGIGAATGVALAMACSASGGERNRVSGGEVGDGGSAGSGSGGTAGLNTGGAGLNNPSIDAGGGQGGGTGGGGDGACFAVGQEAKTQMQPADIIWAVDTSCSMFTEAAFVQDNINQFSQQIIASGIDVHVIMLASAPLIPFLPAVCVAPPLGSGGCTPQGADSKPPSFFHHPTAIVNSTDGLNVFYNTFPEWRNQLRPNASKSLVIVTDDDARDAPYVTADAFIQAFTARDPALLADPATGAPAWTMNGIYSFTACAGAAAVGMVWADLITKTGGVAGDLCTQNFQPVFDRLAEKIVTGSQPLECQWGIPEAPAGETFDPTKVNVQFTDMDSGTQETIYKAADAAACDPVLGGWHYNDNQYPTQVVACPASCDKIKGVLQGKVEVLFGCSTEPRPVPQ